MRSSALVAEGLAGRPIYFCHVPRTGGTTLTNWVSSCLPEHECYPSATEPVGRLVEKMFFSALADQDEASRRRIRFASLHLPISVAALLPNAATAVLLRHPVDQLRSSIDRQRSDAEGVDRFVLSGELTDVEWYQRNQLGWFLGASLDDVRAVYRQLAFDADTEVDIGHRLAAAIRSVLSTRDPVAAAVAAIETIDLMALSDERDAVVAPIAAWMGVSPPDPSVRLNRTTPTEIPAAMRSDLESTLEGELVIYHHAVERIRARASGGSDS